MCFFRDSIECSYFSDGPSKHIGKPIWQWKTLIVSTKYNRSEGFAIVSLDCKRANLLKYAHPTAKLLRWHMIPEEGPSTAMLTILSAAWVEQEHENCSRTQSM